ncbi:hypothetical protein [Colwellia sp. Arc7-D]|uniref:hypothetical protein n=1 Tax=Colwellia sp. Arc7-D TaxID=2161872 RepID=UPI00194FB056|nr:hypothetical protein [Colwellia sp. Arc7-D]
MKTVVSELSLNDREGWESLYYEYAEFYKVPMDQTILDTVWSWIFDVNNKFYALVAKDESGNYLGFMHYRAMPSPLRGSWLVFLMIFMLKLKLEALE